MEDSENRPNDKMDPEKKRFICLGVTGTVVAVLGLICFFVIYRAGDLLKGLAAIAGILAPFAYGAVIAYILTPACNWVERLLTRLFHFRQDRRGLVTGLAILISFLAAGIILWVLIMLVFPQVWQSVIGIAEAIPGELVAANLKLHDVLTNRPEIQARWDEFSGGVTKALTDWIKTDLLSAMGTMVGMVGSQMTAVFGVLKNLFLGILISIYILSSRKRFAAQSRLLLHGMFSKPWADRIEEEVRYADRMFNGFLMGKLLDSTIIGALCFAGTALMGIRSAALISVIVGVTNIIPFFGPFIGAIPCALLLLLENPLHCLYFVIFVIVLQQLDGNVIGPKILGNSTGLSSFWVMFSILLFGGLWGITGMVIGVPLCAVLYDIARRLVFSGLSRHGRGDLAESYNQEFHAEPVQKEKRKKRW